MLHHAFPAFLGHNDLKPKAPLGSCWLVKGPGPAATVQQVVSESLPVHSSLHLILLAILPIDFMFSVYTPSTALCPSQVPHTILRINTVCKSAGQHALPVLFSFKFKPCQNQHEWDSSAVTDTQNLYSSQPIWRHRGHSQQQSTAALFSFSFFCTGAQKNQKDSGLIKIHAL